VSDRYKWLEGGSEINLVFLVLAIAGLTLSVFLYLKGKKEKLPVYLMKTFTLLNNNLTELDGIAISFKGMPIQSLALSKVSFWNRGAETINETDIVATDPLRIEVVGDDKLYAARIAFQKNPHNAPTVVVDSGKALIKFDYLDRMDGVVVDVYHSGNSKIEILGTIKGAGMPKKAIFSVAGYLLDKIARCFDWVPDPATKGILNKLIYFAVLPVEFMFAVVIVMPLLVLDFTEKPFQRVPKDYSLEE
jgi:hypothetical protein